MTRPRSSLLVIACILQLMVFSGNAATLDTVPPKPNCSASNFQLPETEEESHVVIHPLGKIYKADGLTISFAVKIMKLTEYPTALSYVFGNKLQFSLELPGAGSVSRVLKQNRGFWMTINSVRLGKEHPALPLDKWFQITAIWNGDTGMCTIYKDGDKVVESQDDDFMTDFKKGGSFVIGQEPPRFRKTSRLIGSVMELRVWPEALEGDELNALLDGDFSVNIGELVDVPVTYELELKNGSRCDKECAPGKFIVQDTGLAMKCQNCSPGQFSMEIASAKCLPCPPGKFSKENGSSHCLPCPRGQFSKENGSSLCLQCPPGQFSKEIESTKCFLCPPGNFSSSLGGKHCPPCAVGTYQDEQGMKECKNCEADFYTTEVGKQICKRCPEHLPAIEAPTFRQCLDGKLALIAAAGTQRDTKISQNIVQGTATDKKISKIDGDIRGLKAAGTTRNGHFDKIDGKLNQIDGDISGLKERHCESGEVTSTVEVTFQSPFVKTPTVTMSTKKQYTSKGYGLDYQMEPVGISTSGFTAKLTSIGAEGTPTLTARWMACSS